MFDIGVAFDFVLNKIVFCYFLEKTKASFSLLIIWTGGKGKKRTVAIIKEKIFPLHPIDSRINWQLCVVLQLHCKPMKIQKKYYSSKERWGLPSLNTPKRLVGSGGLENQRRNQVIIFAELKVLLVPTITSVFDFSKPPTCMSTYFLVHTTKIFNLGTSEFPKLYTLLSKF